MTEGNEKPAKATPQAEVADKAAMKDARRRGQRSLIIMVMLMFFVSIVVFVVGTFFFVVPRVIAQDLEIRHLQVKLAALHEALSAPQDESDDAAPAAPEAPEVEPAELEK